MKLCKECLPARNEVKDFLMKKENKVSHGECVNCKKNDVLVYRIDSKEELFSIKHILINVITDNEDNRRVK